jgi:predicted HicB family RNase H-like nuclease
MKTVTYKGFQASVEFEDDALFVRVLHIPDLLVAQCESAKDVQETLKRLVDEYLETCNELGREPNKPFSGTLNVRIGADLHRRAAMAAAERKESINAWIAEAISQRVECDDLTARIGGKLEDIQRDAEVVHIARGHVSEAVVVERRVEVAQVKSLLYPADDEKASSWGRFH